MFMQPMLLEKREQPFNDDRYLYEPKIDGHRMILSLSAGTVRLYTRHNNDVTQQYPELHGVPTSAREIVLDGEVSYVEPENGTTDFEMVMRRFRMTKAPQIKAGMRTIPIQFFAFDILQLNGEDVRSRPLTERKELLNTVLGDNNHYSRVISVDEAGTALFDLIKQRGLEGIVAKRKDSRYVGRRSSDWLKIINYQYAVVTIVGYRKDQFGWLVQHEGRPVGIIELAVPIAHKQAFYGVSKSIVTGEDRNFVYVQPVLKARVRFRNWYRSGKLRSPEFVEFVGL
ncbi:ATP-dependent DNA ligase [Paenibacillaceae bacterium]|nr:ATP-dependent DNA ligase [Paenibacillaceae bacterium]